MSITTEERPVKSLAGQQIRADMAARRAGGEVAVPAPAAVAVPDCPVDGEELLDQVADYSNTYADMPSISMLVAFTGWILHAVARDRDDTGLGQLIWRASPRLLLTAKERGTGKSTVLDLVTILTRCEGKIPKITPAAYAKRVGKKYQTAVLDEAKTIFGKGGKNLELQGCLLSGYTRRTNYEISGRQYDLFGAMAYGGRDELITTAEGEQIGDLLDRSIILRMERSARVMPEVDEYAEDDGDALAGMLIRWTDMKRAELRAAARLIAEADQRGEPCGSPRSAQIWRPLRAIALVAGGHWVDHMDEAMSELSGVALPDAQPPGAEEAAAAMESLRERRTRWAPSPFAAADDDDEDDL